MKYPCDIVQWNVFVLFLAQGISLCKALDLCSQRGTISVLNGLSDWLFSYIFLSVWGPYFQCAAAADGVCQRKERTVSGAQRWHCAAVSV